MSDSELAVLLVGESITRFSRIIERLRTGGCHCRFAHSYEEARELVAAEAFDLVLTVLPLRERAITSLADALAGERTTAFYCQRVEDTSRWLPILRDGQRCFGEPALRPTEFAGALDAIAQGIRARARSNQEADSAASGKTGAEASAALKVKSKGAG